MIYKDTKDMVKELKKHYDLTDYEALKLNLIWQQTEIMQASLLIQTNTAEKGKIQGEGIEFAHSILHI